MHDIPDPVRPARTGSLDDVSLSELLGLFPAGLVRGRTEDTFETVASSELPVVYRRLLVHEHHMTVTLERHHASPVVLSARRIRAVGDDYARELTLSREIDGRIVMAGIMRIRLEYCSSDVRAAIEAARAPLGRILIEHRVLRRLELKSLLRARLDTGLGEVFAHEVAAHGAAETFGRIALIHCDGEPAVELLEIVAPESKR